MHKISLRPSLHPNLDIHASPQQKASRQSSKSRRLLLFLAELPLIAVDSDLHVTDRELLESFPNMLICEREHSHGDALPRLAKVLDVQFLHILSGREMRFGSALA